MEPAGVKPELALVARARAWRHQMHAAICDVLEPWPHGTIARASRYPTYYEFNLVRVEDDPAMSVDALVAVADRALAGLSHRRVDFDVLAVGERLRPGFEEIGWKVLRLLWMRHDGRRDGGGLAVEEVPYDAVEELRIGWHTEDFPGIDPTAFHAQSREVSLARDVQVFAVREAGVPVAFAQLERVAGAAEIAQVYVHPGWRNRGLGTATTAAAIRAAGDVEDLWICADDEDRAKHLYARLGFVPVWTMMEFTRWPA